MAKKDVMFYASNIFAMNPHATIRVCRSTCHSWVCRANEPLQVTNTPPSASTHLSGSSEVHELRSEQSLQSHLNSFIPPGGGTYLASGMETLSARVRELARRHSRKLNQGNPLEAIRKGVMGMPSSEEGMQIVASVRG